MSTRPRADDDVPVLTDVVEVGIGVSPIAADVAKAIAQEVERAVLASLGDELDRLITQHLARSFEEFVDAARADLSERVRKLAQEAVVNALTDALGSRTRPE